MTNDRRPSEAVTPGVCSLKPELQPQLCCGCSFIPPNADVSPAGPSGRRRQSRGKKARSLCGRKAGLWWRRGERPEPGRRRQISSPPADQPPASGTLCKPHWPKGGERLAHAGHWNWGGRRSQVAVSSREHEQSVSYSAVGSFRVGPCAKRMAGIG